MLGKGIGAGNWSGLRAPIIQPPVDIVAARGCGQYPVVPLARASVGTYVDEDGTIKTAAVNEPRFDWTGGERALLLEAAATNLFTHSKDLSVGWASTANVTQSVDAGAAPDGGDMRKITTNLPYGGDAALRKEGVGVVTGQTYTVSVFVRRDQNRFAKLSGFGNGGSGITFDLQTGAHQINATWIAGGVDLISPQFARIWGVVTPINNVLTFLGMVSNINGNAVWLGGESLSYWGADIKIGHVLSSYVETGATTVTRAADLPSVDIAAGTYDLEVVTDAGTTTLLGVVHAGGAYWPEEATGRVYQVTATAA